MPETHNGLTSLSKEVDVLRNEFNRHQDIYRADRGQTDAAITGMRRDIDTFRGGMGFLKWTLGISVPAIVTLLIAILITKH